MYSCFLRGCICHSPYYNYIVLYMSYIATCSCRVIAACIIYIRLLTWYTCVGITTGKPSPEPRRSSSRTGLTMIIPPRKWLENTVGIMKCSATRTNGLRQSGIVAGCPFYFSSYLPTLSISCFLLATPMFSLAQRTSFVRFLAQSYVSLICTVSTLYGSYIFAYVSLSTFSLVS